MRESGDPTVADRRDERQVFEELSSSERELLRRVLEIERARLHARDADLTDELINAVRGIIK